MENRSPSHINETARADFQAALRKGFWHSVVGWITQSRSTLLPYDEIRKSLPLSNQHYIGMREIPIDQIIGSVSRYQDFDKAFLPLQTHTQGRWMSIDRAHLSDIILPPIEVYKIGSTYYVKDGNHRVSVARLKGQKYIDADVIEIEAPVPVDPNVDIDDLILRLEHADFMERTRLDAVHPEVQIRLTLPGGYERLIEHISVHRYFLGEQRQQDISWEDAVSGWIEQVYLPLVYVIREYKVLKQFPRRTETDLYLWIIEHLWYLREEYKSDVSLEAAAAHFTDEFSPRPLRQLLSMVRRTVRFLAEPDKKDDNENLS
jgi:uncharacterized ParB-like nuclease family protein